MTLIIIIIIIIIETGSAYYGVYKCTCVSVSTFSLAVNESLTSLLLTAVGSWPAGLRLADGSANDWRRAISYFLAQLGTNTQRRCSPLFDAQRGWPQHSTGPPPPPQSCMTTVRRSYFLIHQIRPRAVRWCVYVSVISARTYPSCVDCTDMTSLPAFPSAFVQLTSSPLQPTSE